MKIEIAKDFLMILLLVVLCFPAFSQVFSNSPVIANISAENPFLDASSNFDLSVDPSSNGKGFLFPRVDLTTFVFRTEVLDGVLFPSAYDGMVVYNVGTGTTPTSQGVLPSSVFPGFYYFKNPNAGGNPWATLDIIGGEWIRFEDVISIPTGNFHQLRADASSWLSDSVTLVSSDVVLTQTGDSIAFGVDWDSLSAYPDTTVTNALFETLGAYYDTLDLQSSGGSEVHWNNLTNIPSDIADGDQVIAIKDTMIAYWDSLRGIPASIADGDGLGFQRLRANSSVWLGDSVTLVQGTNVTLTQTGDSITIASTGADNHWTRSGNIVRTYNTTDSVGIGLATPTAKLDVQGGITMRGSRFRGTDATGADTFSVWDSGDTTFVSSDNPIKIGNGSLVVGTNGNVYARDSLYIGKYANLPDADSVLAVKNGKVYWTSPADNDALVTKCYGEFYIASTTSMPWTDGTWQTCKQATRGLNSNLPYVNVSSNSAAQDDSITIGPQGAGFYQVVFNLSFTAASGWVIYLEAAIAVNGVRQPKLMAYSAIGPNDPEPAPISGILFLKAGDVVTVQWRDSSGGAYWIVYNLNLHLTRISL